MGNDSSQHGYKRYRKHRCRCPECRRANAMRTRMERADRMLRLQADPTIREHGRRNTYHNWGCRCIPCCAAMGKTPEKAPPAERTVPYRSRYLAPQRTPGSPPIRAHLLYQSTRRVGTAEPFGRDWVHDEPIRSA